jgi:hypothetical protein
MADEQAVPQQPQQRMLKIPQITAQEVDSLATEWCKAKHVVVMIDQVSRQFALDVANKVLRDMFMNLIAQAAAKRGGPPPVGPQPTVNAPKQPSRIKLTDGD